MIFVLMGVSGVGKSTIGQCLAARLGLLFYDGDDFHSLANRAKLARGEPLTDADRAPWLMVLGELIQTLLATHQGAVLACSALKASHRQVLRGDRDGVQFIYLKGDYALIRQRLQQRQGHFMPPSLLTSQFDILEEPEETWIVDVTPPPDQVVAVIVELLGWSGE